MFKSFLSLNFYFFEQKLFIDKNVFFAATETVWRMGHVTFTPMGEIKRTLPQL
jgi:hypothetical protein